MDDSHPSVRRLIGEARGGRDGALDQLLRRYRGYLRFLARSGLDSTIRVKADASDVAQEALLKAYRGFARFEGETERELAAWLRKVLASAVASILRRYRGKTRQVDRERAIEADLDRSSAALSRLLPTSGTSPSREAQAHERSVLLARAIDELAEDRRRVVLLRSFRQLSWEEVAETMGRSAEAVRKLWTRAIRDLARSIGGTDL